MKRFWFFLWSSFWLETRSKCLIITRNFRLNCFELVCLIFLLKEYDAENWLHLQSDLSRNKKKWLFNIYWSCQWVRYIFFSSWILVAMQCNATMDCIPRITFILPARSISIRPKVNDFARNVIIAKFNYLVLRWRESNAGATTERVAKLLGSISIMSHEHFTFQIEFIIRFFFVANWSVI